MKRDEFWAGAKKFKVKEFWVYENVWQIEMKNYGMGQLQTVTKFLVKHRPPMLSTPNKLILQKWLKQSHPQHQMKFFQLLYKAKRDGDTSPEVWEKIQDKERLLFIFRSHNYKTFGGYISR